MTWVVQTRSPIVHLRGLLRPPYFTTALPPPEFGLPSDYPPRPLKGPLHHDPVGVHLLHLSHLVSARSTLPRPLFRPADVTEFQDHRPRGQNVSPPTVLRSHQTRSSTCRNSRRSRTKESSPLGGFQRLVPLVCRTGPDIPTRETDMHFSPLPLGVVQGSVYSF